MASGDLDPKDLLRLEEVIRGAGRYVEPTDDLRPKVLEAAREQTARSQSRRRVLKTAAAILIVIASSVPGRWFVANSGINHWGYVAAFEVQQHAVRRSLVMNVDPVWALIDVLCEQRQSQAEQLTPNR